MPTQLYEWNVFIRDREKDRDGNPTGKAIGPIRNTTIFIPGNTVAEVQAYAAKHWPNLEYLGCQLFYPLPEKPVEQLAWMNRVPMIPTGKTSLA